MSDNGTPLQRLRAAVDQLSRAEERHAEKRAALASAQRQVELKATEEAAAADAVEAAKQTVKRAAREVQ